VVGGAGGLLAELKSDPGRLGLKTLLGEIDKLERVRAVGLSDELFADVSEKLLGSWRARAAKLYPSDLRASPPAVRLTLLAALCSVRTAELTDGLVDLLARYASHPAREQVYPGRHARLGSTAGAHPTRPDLVPPAPQRAGDHGHDRDDADRPGRPLRWRATWVLTTSCDGRPPPPSTLTAKPRRWAVAGALGVPASPGWCEPGVSALLVVLDAVADQPERRRPQADEQRAALGAAALVLADRLRPDPQADAQRDRTQGHELQVPAAQADAV